MESIRLPCYEMVEFDDVEQLQVDPKALQYSSLTAVSTPL